jgi:putative PEP-CTERM system histidine kinase
MNPTFTLGVLAALAAFGLGVFVFAREGRSLVSGAFAAGMMLLAVESLCAGLSARVLLPEDMLFWQKLRLFAMAWMPSSWLAFTLTYSRGNYAEFLKKWRPILWLCLVVPPAIAIVGWNLLVVEVLPAMESYYWPLRLGEAGILVTICFLSVAVVAVANLEKTLRGATGTMRWRIKFMVIGLSTLLAARFYTGVQILLQGHIDPAWDSLNALALMTGCALTIPSVVRSGLRQVDLYLSTRFLRGSATVLLVGLYLFGIGVMARFIDLLDREKILPLRAFFLFLAAGGLCVLFFSDRVRQVMRLFISRHFRRPEHDYRRVWTEFSARTASATDTGAFARALAQFVSDVFESLSVTVWLADGARGRLSFGASTSLSEAVGNAMAGRDEVSAALMEALARQEQPVALDRSDEGWVTELKKWNPDVFNKGGGRLCASLVAGGNLLGVLTMGDRVKGIPYTVEDVDLFGTIGGQAAARLLSIRLSERLVEAKQMEAFQTMSTFFVHDLKNTASTLSLMLQNLPKHFEDASFRDDALRAMTRSVGKINEMITRLATLRQKLEVKPREVDLNEWFSGVIQKFETEAGLRIRRTGCGEVRVVLDPEQMQKVLTNLVLNARDASGPDGEIEAAASVRDGWAVLSVRDHGCGMPGEFVEKSLFRPFQSTKKEGMGIGLYQSRSIVEAHGGRIEVESEPGVGSTFRVLLPCGGRSE